MTSLDPFPEGWYFLTSRRALLKDKLIQKTWMGQKIVIWGDKAGNVCAAEAYCPHLGADLRPAAGGRLCEDRLICPFHGFEFDTSGQCVATPFAPAPKAARLRVFETREVAGMIFAWWGINRDEPRWHLPEEAPDQKGWCTLKTKTMRLVGHPQETSENSVDIAHFWHVHGYEKVERVDKITIDGPYLQSRFNFTSTRRIAGRSIVSLEFAACAHVFGLGYSFVEVHEHTIGMDMRIWVLATPVDGIQIDLSMCSQIRELRNPKRPILGLGFLPLKLRAASLNQVLMILQTHDARQDVIIWGNKQHLRRPRLCRSDGEIMQFRAYCSQFYADSNRAD